MLLKCEMDGTSCESAVLSEDFRSHGSSCSVILLPFKLHPSCYRLYESLGNLVFCFFFVFFLNQPFKMWVNTGAVLIYRVWLIVAPAAICSCWLKSMLPVGNLVTHCSGAVPVYSDTAYIKLHFH